MNREEQEMKRNASGYIDPTAYTAIQNAESSERHKKLLGCIFRICELSDFYVEERIVVRDKRTGRIYR